MKGLPKAHIATNPGEIDAHGPHVDLIAKTSIGSHQVRVHETIEGKRYAISADGTVIGETFEMNGREYFLDDQHNVSARFDDLGHNQSVNLNPHEHFSNREDRLMGNGQPDPRGTSMGGYNPRQ